MSAYQRWMNVGFDKRRCTARLDFGAPSVLYIEADAQSGDSGHRAVWNQRDSVKLDKFLIQSSSSRQVAYPNTSKVESRTVLLHSDVFNPCNQG
ncbi:hypothetical protein DMENIID0001_037810 [Sergentomyia squamirostris]